jgi:deoxycytidylate deaminase
MITGAAMNFNKCLEKRLQVGAAAVNPAGRFLACGCADAFSKEQNKNKNKN